MSSKLKFLLFILLTLSFLIIVVIGGKYIVIKKEKYTLLKENSLLCKKNKSILNSFRHRFTGVLLKDEDGSEVFVDPQDNIVSNYLILNGSWESHVRNVIKQIVKPGMRVVCLGGHIGVHEILISRLVGSSGRVFVFEPNPKILKYTKANIYFSYNNNITLFEKAAYSENTKLEFSSLKADENSGHSHIIFDEAIIEDNADRIVVDAITLDSISELEKGIDVIQMDIEGAEIDAIYGAKKLIENSANLIVIQEWDIKMMGTERVPKYIKFWRDQGYKFAEIVSSGDKLVEKTDTELMVLMHTDIVIAKNLDEIIANFKPYVKPVIMDEQ